MYKTFRNVAGGVILGYKAPDPTDPKGYGTGRALLNEYFWSTTRFRLQYLLPGHMRPIEGKAGQKMFQPPSVEYLAVDGAKKMRRGGEVGNMANYSPSQKLFDAASDAQLVEAWPTQFPKYLFSPFVGGNATLTRYVNAILRGVGGYQVMTWTRTVRYNGATRPQYRITAVRGEKPGKPASRVEMVFDGTLSLPVTINTTYGEKNELQWRTTWLNNQKIPGSPFQIKQ